MSAFDWRGLPLAERILGACGVLLFIDLLFTWQGVSILGTTVGSAAGTARTACCSGSR